MGWRMAQRIREVKAAQCLEQGQGRWETTQVCGVYNVHAHAKHCEGIRPCYAELAGCKMDPLAHSYRRRKV